MTGSLSFLSTFMQGKKKKTVTEWMDNAMEHYEKQCMCVLFNKADTTWRVFTIKSPENFTCQTALFSR